MALDLLGEEAISLMDVPKFVPKRNGKKVHYSTVYRWATRGARGRVLETAFSGGCRYTTLQAIGRFLSARGAAHAIPKDDLGCAVEAALRRAGLGA